MSTNKVLKKTKRGFGDSDTSTMTQMFPANPMPDYEPLPIAQGILDGVTIGNEDFGPVSMDYTGSPKLEDPEGLIDDPFAFVPNVSSPGPGSINPADKPAPPDTHPPPSSGAGSSESPAEGASKVSGQKIGELIFGSSSPA